MNRQLYVVGGVVTYVCLLHWVYTSYIPPIFSNSIYHHVPTPWLTLVIHGLIACIPSLWMPTAIVRPSQMVYWIHYVALYIPSVMVPMYAAAQPPIVLLLYSLLFLAMFGVWGGMYSVPEVRLPRIRKRMFTRNSATPVTGAVRKG